jgi:hypothetical protein
MRHEIARDAVVGVIEEDFHRLLAILQSAASLRSGLKAIDSARENSSPGAY